MSDETYRLLREYIYQQTGIYFQDNKKYLLEGRLGKRLQVLNVPSFEQYLQLIRYGTRRNEELQAFLRRHHDQRDVLFPERTTIRGLRAYACPDASRGPALRGAVEAARLECSQFVG